MEENPEKVGELFADRYRIEAYLGKGASGAVYLVTDLETSGKVALKVISSEFFGSSQVRRRFTREAGILKGIHHPNILSIIRSGTFEDSLYHVMEYCESGNLAECMIEKASSTDQAVALMIQICEGIKVLHTNKILHRDIKAENILVGNDGYLKVADFGLAQWQSTDFTKTKSVGTPTGMAPELWNGEDASERSDIYALGVLFYELVTHQRPFKGTSIGEIAHAHLFTTPPPLLGLCALWSYS